MKFKKIIVGLFLGLLYCSAYAEQITIAVAANFSAPMKVLAKAFELETGNTVLLVFGSSGKLYAQIKNGAPFDVLLSGDQKTPQTLEEEGLAVPGTRMTYAVGSLVLWSAKTGHAEEPLETLKKGEFQHLAIANPQLAPYGAAAMEVLKKLELVQKLQDKLVQGENIGQAYQYVVSGNAEFGLLALSQVMENGKINVGQGWIVPDNLYAPIRQDAIVLKQAQKKPAAAALLQFLKSEKTLSIIEGYGY